jgi:hypothetical protein
MKMKNHKLLASTLIFLLFCNIVLNAQEGNQPRRMMMPQGTYRWAPLMTRTTIPFELDKDLITISVEINGVNTKLILDTGMPAMGALLNNSNIANKLNLSYSGEAKIGGAGGGSVNAKIASGVKFKIGDLEFSNQTLIVMPDSPNNSFFEFHGVIGAEIFNRFIVDIDYEMKTLTINEPSTYTIKSDVEELALTFINNYPLISCTSTLESGKVVPLNLVFDIGAGHSLSLNIGSQKDIILPNKKINVSLGRGADSELFGFMGRIKEFKLGKFAFRNVLVSFTEGQPAPWEKEGNLGSVIMRRFNITIDYPNKRLFIKPNKFLNEPFEFNMAGIQTSKSNDGIVKIDRVLPNTAGSEAGLMAGDLIVKINKTSIANINKAELENIFKKENEVVELIIKRGEIAKIISVKLRRII